MLTPPHFTSHAHGVLFWAGGMWFKYHAPLHDYIIIMRETIAFIGGGNMATSLIGGLLAAGHPAERVIVVDPAAERRNYLHEKYAVQVLPACTEAAANADVWVLAVKPQVMRAVVADLPAAAPLVVSVAAGISLNALGAWLKGTPDIVRCMPNTPALVGAGASALCAAPQVATEQRAIAETILQSAGLVVWVQTESEIDAVTATSGSGPAYFFALMEAMQACAQEMGLAPDTARQLVLQTAFGAARMALESGDDPATLRKNVTSPGGTTERALTILEEGGFDLLIGEAMRAAAGRSEQLARELAE